MPIRLIFMSDSHCLSDKLIISVWHIDAVRWEESIPLPYELNEKERNQGLLDRDPFEGV